MKNDLMTKLVPAVLIATGLLMGCGGDHDHDGHNHDGNGSSGVSGGDDGYPLKSCVVSGDDLGSMGSVYVHKHEGVTVKFCCDSCLKDFEKDPKTYLAKLKTAGTI
jgi:YHS domain-containing protein